MKKTFRTALSALTLLLVSACGTLATPTPVAQAEPLAKINSSLGELIEITPNGQKVLLWVETSINNPSYDWKLTGSGTLSNTVEPEVQYIAPQSVEVEEEVSVTVTVVDQDDPSRTASARFRIRLIPPTPTPTSIVTDTPTSTPAVTEPPAGETPTVEPPISALAPCPYIAPPVIRPPFSASSLEFTIDVPAHCAELPALKGFPVGGKGSTALSAGVSMWLLIYPSTANKYYPQCKDAAQSDCSLRLTAGVWQTNASLGGCGESFHLVLIETDSAGNEFLHKVIKRGVETGDYSVTREELDDAGIDVKEIDSIEVLSGEGCTPTP